MTEVGNAIMENGGLEREGGGTEYWRSFQKERTGGGRKDQGGPFEKKRVVCLELGGIVRRLDREENLAEFETFPLRLMCS